MKKIAFFSLIILAVLFLGWIFYQAVSPRGGVAISTPSPVPQAQTGGNNSLPNNYSWSIDNKDLARRSFLIGKLINKLPYSGINFSLSYDFDKDVFLLSLNKSKIDDANKEFDSFLSQNEISSRLWFENLTISYK